MLRWIQQNADTRKQRSVHRLDHFVTKYEISILTMPISLLTNENHCIQFHFAFSFSWWAVSATRKKSEKDKTQTDRFNKNRVVNCSHNFGGNITLNHKNDIYNDTVHEFNNHDR